MSPFDVILLDAGNTVLHLDDAAAAHALAATGMPVTAAVVREAHRMARQRVDRALLDGEDVTDATWGGPLLDELAVTNPARRAECLAGLKGLHERHLLFRHVPLGVRAALSRLRGDGLRLCIVSNSEGQLEELLRRAGVLSHFERVIDSGVAGVAKPDPAIFRRALEEMGVAADRAVHVGDLVSQDVEGARSAGIAAVLVDDGGAAPAPDGVSRIASLAELPALLARERRQAASAE